MEKFISILADLIVAVLEGVATFLDYLLCGIALSFGTCLGVYAFYVIFIQGA